MSSSNEGYQKARETLFNEGIQIRKEVTGAEHVQRSWANVSDFSRPMQELATEAGWGLIWGRDGLDRRTRSLLNLAMLSALGKSNELGVHVRGALNNGCTEKEIQETLLQSSIYAGLPVGLEAFRVAQKVVDEERAKSSTSTSGKAEKGGKVEVADLKDTGIAS
ncbi:hypothetical protein E8E14_013345 [Neopestalotiopsis sp. 37M]|nr:hypothetical protein E8E14_013345 [Neopestalotiopsis sp. 37M]